MSSQLDFMRMAAGESAKNPEEPGPFFEKMLASARDFAREFLAGSVKTRIASI